MSVKVAEEIQDPEENGLDKWMGRPDAPEAPKGKVVTFSGTARGKGLARFGPAEPQDKGED